MKDYPEIGQLCLQLNVGDSFTIGEDIRITRLPRIGYTIALCIQAPKDIPILRDKAIKRQPKNE